MATAYKHLPLDRRIVLFAQQRLGELKQEIEDREQEMVIWDALLQKLKPCEECKGQGAIRLFIAQDESETRECEKCKGKGVLGWQ
jgi:hypothetical protein